MINGNNMNNWIHPIDNRRVISSHGGETTPFVFKDKLYRLENIMRSQDFPKKPPQFRFHEDGFRIVDVEADRIISYPLLNHYFATAFVWDDRVHVFSVDYEENEWWNNKRYVKISSSDLVTWTSPETVIKTDSEYLFNNSVCYDGQRFVMLIETADPKWVKSFKFYTSSDLINWTLLEGASYGTEKVGAPALYYYDNTYYVLYIGNKDNKGGYVTRITRSHDLFTWEDAPEERPFLSYDSSYETNPKDFPGVMEKNASDAELCEWQGKTIIYFGGGNQAGCGDTKEAVFNGLPSDLLKTFF